MRYDFTYIEALRSRARRERAEAVHRLLIAPILALFSRPTDGNNAEAVCLK